MFLGTSGAEVWNDSGMLGCSVSRFGEVVGMVLGHLRDRLTGSSRVKAHGL